MATRPEVNRPSIFLDELSLSAAWRLIWNRDLAEVTVLEAMKPSRRFLVRALRAKRINVVQAEFFTGYLRTSDGEAVRRVANRESGEVALIAAKRIVDGAPALSDINDRYGRNTIVLFLAKQLQGNIFYWTLRSRVAQALSTEGRPLIWLKKPMRFDEKVLTEHLTGADYVFYRAISSFWVRLAVKWMLDVVREIMQATIFLQRPSVRPLAEDKPGVLALQEDQIRYRPDLRGQPHWLDRENPNKLFNTYIIKILPPRLCVPEEERLLSQLDVKVIPTAVFRLVTKRWKDNVVLAGVRSDRRNAIRAIFRVTGYARKEAFFKVASLLKQAEAMGSLAMSLNIRVFLNSEPQFPLADAMQLVAPLLNVKTLVYQYSNLSFGLPIMMSTADKFLLFSDMYRATYVSDGISPKEFVSIGYPFGCVSSLVRERARHRRAELTSKGARFVVCYFDESVQHDRWGLVSKQDHLGELHVLAEKVLFDPTFGVVVKSQFIFNSPSKLYPGDELVRMAKATGRVLELQEGSHRNDIYPVEAALVSDLCIGHKFGATAPLEAALSGVRAVVLNTYGSASLWNAIYALSDIEYETMESLMAEIERYRCGEADHQMLGDWSPILHYFDPYRDGCAQARLRNIVEQACEHKAEPTQTTLPRADLMNY
jgi:hypothetical protein